MDTLFRKSRESGPIRAQGKSNKQVDDQNSRALRNPQVNYPTDLDDRERPVKRQRRNISSPASTAVIDLVDDEDGKFRTSSPVLSPKAPREHRLSSTSSQNSARARKPLESRNEVDEYREVEKLMSTALRGNSNKNNLQKKRDLFANDDRAEPAVLNTKQRRPRSPSSDNEKVSAKFDQRTKRSVFESVEICNSANGIGAKVSRKSPTLQRQFVPTNGKRRTSDMRESPDELQGEATVQPAPSSLSFPKKRDPASESRSTDPAGSDARKSTRPMSPSDIRPTIFAGSRQGQGKKQRKLPKDSSGKSHLRLFEASFFRFGSVKRVASQEQAFQVFFDNSNETIGLAAATEAGAAQDVTIPVRKVAQALHGPDGSGKVRLKLSKTEGSFDEEIDIEFLSEEDKVDLCGLLESKGVTVRERER